MVCDLRHRIGILSVDSNVLAAGTLERWLSHDPALEWLGWLPSAEHLTSAVAVLSPDVVLVEPDTPGVKLDWVVRELSDMAPGVKVLVLSGNHAPAAVVSALDAGASGYIVKDERVPWIAQAIQRAARGELVLSTCSRSAVAGRGHAPGPPRLGPHLTDFGPLPLMAIEVAAWVLGAPS